MGRCGCDVVSLDGRPGEASFENWEERKADAEEEAGYLFCSFSFCVVFIFLQFARHHAKESKFLRVPNVSLIFTSHKHIFEFPKLLQIVFENSHWTQFCPKQYLRTSSSKCLISQPLQSSDQVITTHSQDIIPFSPSKAGLAPKAYIPPCALSTTLGHS